ncbi:hypothetical protein BLNAU_20127 [Blattamonas nauphoetae]|uniref:Uncharacterized protein n=1 Tax=Blattamonas nauphoetae TaxID=2049346 RepID=A0ABQ9X2V0_9EUKA|nr:hypothetical protein BLNAU_20127 [Blattamonas nauphoetae]
MRPIRSRKSKDLSSHILHCGLTPTVALLRQMESSDIDYQIQQLYGSMTELRNKMREKWERERKRREQRKQEYSQQPTLDYFPIGLGGGGAQLRDENGRIVIAKYVPSGRQSTINNHPAHEKSQLNTVPADRIPQQDRQPHKEGPDIRHLTVPMEKREMVTDAVERVTDNVPSELKRKKQEVGNEEREVEEMGGMVKEIGCRERGMGEKSEIRKRQSLEFREELRMQIEEKKREREEERKKARQDEDEEEGDGEHHSSQTTRDDANQRRAGLSLSDDSNQAHNHRSGSSCGGFNSRREATDSTTEGVHGGGWRRADIERGHSRSGCIVCLVET